MQLKFSRFFIYPIAMGRTVLWWKNTVSKKTYANVLFVWPFFIVRANNAPSSPTNHSCGDWPGSVICSLIFLLWINDFHDLFFDNVFFIADNVKIISVRWDSASLNNALNFTWRSTMYCDMSSILTCVCIAIGQLASSHSIKLVDLWSEHPTRYLSILASDHLGPGLNCRHAVIKARTVFFCWSSCYLMHSYLWIALLWSYFVVLYTDMITISKANSTELWAHPKARDEINKGSKILIVFNFFSGGKEISTGLDFDVSDLENICQAQP